jgi:hypothetical protein
VKDKFAAPPAYLPLGAWPYWPPNPVTGASTPDGDPWPSASAPTAAVSNAGLLGNLVARSGGLLGSLAGPLADAATARPTINGLVAQPLPTTPSLFLPGQPLIVGRQDQRPSTEVAYDPEASHLAVPTSASDHAGPRDGVGPTTPNAPEEPPRKPSPPFYGPGGALMPPSEPAAPEPPKDFRAWLGSALSDENIRYYLGPHLFEALRKLHALTQLLPGSGTLQSTQDSSRASEEAQAGNYGKAATHLGMGTVNTALDWLPSSKLALIGGTIAKTFPWRKLPTAIEMEAAGRSADDIWRSTGLERDAAGNWIFEISDKGYYIRPNPDTSTASVAPLYEQYVHPGMQKAYPRLSNWRSRLIINPLDERRGSTVFKDRLVQVQARGLEGARNAVGEVVGRNAQRRLHLSDHDRSLWSPRATEDIPRNRQINLFDDDWQ